MDTDISTATAMLDDAQRRSGLTQGAFAAALGTSASRYSTYRTGKTAPSLWFYARAARIADGLAAARQHGLMSALDTSDAIHAAQTWDWAWKMLLQGRDHLREILREYQEAEGAWAAIPESTGHPGLDVALAALVREEYAAAGLEPPAWAREVEALAEPWVTEHPFLSRDEVIDRTPPFLREVNVYIPANDLVTA